MKHLLSIILAVLVVGYVSLLSAETQTTETAPTDTVEEEMPESEEEPLPILPEEPAAVKPPEDEIAQPKVGEQVETTPSDAEEGEGDETREIIIDSLVNLNYTFTGSSDSFIIKYHLHFEGKTAAKTAVVKGNAKIATEVTGFLAKWPTGNCKLTVTVPDAPFGMTFKKTSEDKADLDIKFTAPITETWESICTFKDAPKAKFNTKGDPEKWLAKALEKARPPLTKVTVPVSKEESTTTKFEITKQKIPDPPLGNAEIDGTGVVTINPGR